MPIIDAATLLEDMIGPNIGMGDFGLPEVPDNWGNEGGGYINDYPDNVRGGMSQWNGTNRVFAWWVILCEKSYNPTGANFRVQLKQMRTYRRISGSFDQQQALQDPRGGGKDYLMPGDYNWDFDDTENHPGFAGRVVTPASGGVAIQLINDWAAHGFPMSFMSPNYSTWQAVGVTLFARLIPITEANPFDWENYRVGLNVGFDNYANSSWRAEHCHGRFKRLTNKWQVFASATVKRPNGHVSGGDKPNQGPGMTVSQYNEAPLPIPPENAIWLEKGPFNATTNKQTLVLRRSASVSSAKSYAISKKRGTFTTSLTQVAIAAGASSVQFEVDTPGGAISGSNTLYFTDGNNGSDSMEDHWGTFTIGSGTATGEDPGVPGGTVVTASLPGFDIAALLAAANAQPAGQRGTKYCADVVAELGNNPIFEIDVDGTIVYRTTVIGSLAYSSAGIALPAEFTEPPSINTANALTDTDAKIIIRPASGASKGLHVPLNAATLTGYLKASKALDGDEPVRTQNVVIAPPPL